jgi:hypothetical protein
MIRLNVSEQELFDLIMALYLDVAERREARGSARKAARRFR